ncbi:unnamed protein product [Heterobilharzia americana]|nr:unnamed protein product [Heterobilharzia americana]
MAWISIDFLTLLLITYFVRADVNISYTVKNYQNPYNLDSRLRKCEALNAFGDHCDPFFHFAVFTSTEKWNKRSTLRKEAGPFTNSKYLNKVLEIYEIHSTFPDSIEFELDIQDSDIDDDQRIALFRRQVPLEKKGVYEFRMGVDVKIETYIDITCTKDYYGNRCEVYCIPLQDLWICDETTGARICNKPCLHGKCILTSTSAICECTSEWRGEFCQTPIESKSFLLSLLLKSRLFINNNNNHHNNDVNKQFTSETSTVQTTVQLDSNQEDKSDATELESTDEPIRIVELKGETFQGGEKDSNISDDQPDSLVASKTEMDKQEDSIINPTGLLSNLETRNYIILAFIIIGLLLWLIGILVIGLICYRRRRDRKASVRKSALWTNISYEPSSYQTKHLSITEDFLPQHGSGNHQNEIRFLPNDHTVYPSLKKTSPKGVLRNSSTLPRIPTGEHFQRRSVRYTRSPNDISRLRFGTISCTPVISPSLSMCTQRSTLSPSESCPPNTDTYEELTCCLNDHVNWKNNSPSPLKLTTFQ